MANGLGLSEAMVGWNKTGWTVVPVDYLLMIYFQDSSCVKCDSISGFPLFGFILYFLERSG